jgi:hypothetical protein
MKGRKIGLIVLLVVVGGLGFFATNLIRNTGKSDTELLEFSIKDTSSVDQLIITDQFARKINLIRKDNNWINSDGSCIIQQPVNLILETIKNIQFKGYVPENSRTTIVKNMLSTHTKVEIFQHGKWAKTWYVGFATQDHYGTYMLLETPDEKSDLPVIMKVKGLDGIIEPRFFADARRWKCTEIFKLGLDEISEVDVRFFDVPARSFNVKKKGTNYGVKLGGKKLTQLDTMMAIQYLNNYKKIHYELANFELSDKQVDSLKKSKSFCKLTMKETSGKSTVLKMHRIPVVNKTMNDFGDSVAYNPDRFWCQLPNGEVVKCQYFVFNPLLMGHLYFTKP